MESIHVLLRCHCFRTYTYTYGYKIVNTERAKRAICDTPATFDYLDSDRGI